MGNKGFFILFVLVIIYAHWFCTTDRRADNKAVQKEIKDREILKVTEAQIINKVLEIGNSISVNTQKTLGQNLQKALQEGGVENAISFCNLNAMPLVDSLSKHFDAEIRRVTMKPRNQNDFPTDIEKELLEAYDYQWKDSLPMQSNVQTLEGDKYLFTKPILVENALCLTCHGTFENGLLEETKEFIKSKYPEDQATGYNIGDLRGMWSITISKKHVIQAMQF